MDYRIYIQENRYLYEVWNEYILLLTEYPPHYAPKNGIFQKGIELLVA